MRRAAAILMAAAALRAGAPGARGRRSGEGVGAVLGREALGGGGGLLGGGGGGGGGRGRGRRQT